MNLVLFEAAETMRPLPRQDRRAVHVLEILRRGVGDTFDAGIVNGPRGKATVARVDPETISFTYAWQEHVPPVEPITLIVGLPRPQTARDILREATALGVAAIHFVTTEKGEPGYAGSSLWTSGEWRRHVIAGAEQACVTALPAITFGATLAATVDRLLSQTARIALDPYEATLALGDCPVGGDVPVVLALGAERGWGAGERALLRQHCFALAHLGPRVLRTETAVIASLAVLRSRLGLL